MHAQDASSHVHDKASMQADEMLNLTPAVARQGSRHERAVLGSAGVKEILIAEEKLINGRASKNLGAKPARARRAFQHLEGLLQSLSGAYVARLRAS